MKTAYTIIRKTINAEGENNDNIFTSINKDRVFEVFKESVDKMYDWSNPDVETEQLTAKQTETGEGWRYGNFALVTNYETGELVQTIIGELDYKKRNLFFEVYDGEEKVDKQFKTLKDAKTYIGSRTWREGQKGVIKKIQEFSLEDGNVLYNTLMESPFVFKKGKVSYAKQVKYE